ncbi:uncharacterized protein LOC144166675 [Haemaphysalis longicornis]
MEAHFSSSARQRKKGWVFKEEKYIRRIEVSTHHHSSGCDLFVLRSICLCSMKPGHYRQLAALREDSSGGVSVVQAHCNCVAGLSERCQHVAALLFAVLHVQTPSSTSLPCKWLAPSQGQNRLPPTPLADITFKKHKVNKAVTAKSKRQLQPGLPPLHPDGVQRFTTNIAKDAPPLLWNRYCTGKPAPVRNDSGISDVQDLHSKECLDIVDNHFELKVPLTATERTNLCERTVGQSKNPEWVKERVGRLTASNFSRVLKCVKPESLVKDILYPKKHSTLHPDDPRVYGLKNEALAVEAYEKLMTFYDKNVAVHETGLHVDATFSFIAASPDRLVRDGDDEGILEVKCPASKAGKTVFDACEDKNFCSAIVDGEVQLKRDHPYFLQVQGQLGVTKKPWCDFVIWTDHPELQHCVSVQRIYFEKAVWDTTVGGLLYFYKAAVLPEILTRRIRRLGFLYTTGSGYVSYQKFKEGFYIIDDDEPLKKKIRKFKYRL